MRIAIAGVVVATACAGHIRTEVIGQGTAGIQARGGPPVTTSGVAVTAGSYAITMMFDLPRAQLVDWSVRCPGSDVRGTLGERFEAYRARRIAELADERRHEASVASSIASAVVGPAGSVRVRARTDDLELPPGDVGAGRVIDTVHVDAAGDGACSITAVTDDGNVRGDYRVVRVRDLDAEAHARAMAERDAALHARTALTARLVAGGADAGVRQVRLDAAARVTIEAQARIDAEQARVHTVAIAERMDVEAGLVACGADPERRTHLVAMREAEASAQVDVAMRVRGQLRGQLVVYGAVERSPMPEALAETAGTPPFAGAVWMPGAWTWSGARWGWTKGRWRDDRPARVRRRVIRRTVIVVPVPVPVPVPIR